MVWCQVKLFGHGAGQQLELPDVVWIGFGPTGGLLGRVGRQMGHGKPNLSWPKAVEPKLKLRFPGLAHMACRPHPTVGNQIVLASHLRGRGEGRVSDFPDRRRDEGPSVAAGGVNHFPQSGGCMKDPDRVTGREGEVRESGLAPSHADAHHTPFGLEKDLASAERLALGRSPLFRTQNPIEGDGAAEGNGDGGPLL